MNKLGPHPFAPSMGLVQHSFTRLVLSSLAHSWASVHDMGHDTLQVRSVTFYYGLNQSKFFYIILIDYGSNSNVSLQLCPLSN